MRSSMGSTTLNARWIHALASYVSTALCACREYLQVVAATQVLRTPFSSVPVSLLVMLRTKPYHLVTTAL